MVEEKKERGGESFFIAIDTETGGTRPGQHALLSIALVASWARDLPSVIYVTPESQPGKIVEPDAARINGYSAALWDKRNAVDVRTALCILVAFLEDRFKAQPGALMLAHNAGFDRMFLDEAAAAAVAGVRMPIRHAWRCSMDKMGTLMDRGIIPAGNLKLDRLGELSGQWAPGQRPKIHEADADALACLRGYEWLLEKEKEGPPGAETLHWVRDGSFPDDETSVIIDAATGCETGFRDAGVWRWNNAVLIEESVFGWAHLPLGIGSQKKEGAA